MKFFKHFVAISGCRRDKSARPAGGFTLVELVVVIAVLAILAGVGVVAYNGYIEYAKKGADRQLVGEVVHALDLEYNSEASLSEDGVEGGTVYIGANSSSASNDFAKRAMEDAFGESWKDQLKYKYDEWNTDISGSTFMNESEGVRSVLGVLNKLKGTLGDGLKDLGPLYLGGLPTLLGVVSEDCQNLYSRYIHDYRHSFNLNAALNALLLGIGDEMDESANSVFKKQGGFEEIKLDIRAIRNAMFSKNEEQVNELLSGSHFDFKEIIARYAAMKAFVDYVGDPGLSSQFESAFNDLSNTNGEIAFLEEFIKRFNDISSVVGREMEKSEYSDYFNDENSPAASNEKAFLNFMKQCGSMADYDELVENLGADLLGNEQFIKELESRVGSIEVTIKSNGTVDVNPSEADPRK